ncbi:MAG: prolyl oligopeptidase family serine peptidase [Candidatus Muirbacterium halophilum]|nr:prolyl oligopeptidase family serine peptidase [Candidatus Muirbacterium halophilum]MCK9474498.1 prolyl oligopeptidase family serine peptidase [Candidatus Muirbacterium halophilum]
MKRFFLTVVLFLSVILSFSAGYMEPIPEIVEMVKKQPEPVFVTKVSSGMYVEAYYNALPDISDLAKKSEKIAGVRLDPSNFQKEENTFYTAFKFYSKDRKEIKISGIPQDIKIIDYEFEYTSKYFSFTVKRENTTELWIIDFEKKKAERITSNINTVFTNGMKWVKNSPDEIIVALSANAAKKTPEMTVDSIEPVIQESFGKESKVRTYQDLLKNNYDEKLFEHYFTTILCKINLKTGKKDYITKPGIYYMDSSSPDGNYILATEYKKPFSYTVPFYYFNRDSILIDLKTSEKIILESHKTTDSVPIGGVFTGRRYFDWVPYYPSTLIYAEALDGGDPENEVPFRDSIKVMEKPFKTGKEVLKLKDRYYGLSFLMDKKGEGFITEYEWKKRWIKTYHIDIEKNNAIIKKVEDLSVNDEYNSIGTFCEHRDKTGNKVVILKDGYIYSSAKGASKDGYFPVLYKISLNDFTKSEVFRSSNDKYERFLCFTDETFTKILIKSESSTEYPNYYEYNPIKNSKKQVSFFENPFKVFENVKKEIVKYKREDGIELSGTLYYPPNYKKGQKVPCVLHSYPLEYTGKNTASQVRGSSNTFTKISYMSELFFLLQGIAVFKDAQFPIVGDPKTMNDTFVSQLKMNAQAAIDALKNTNSIDTEKMACIGHSYGAFMVANLLIHTDLFVTGIAQSGAYNRTLTPFGFQSERRTFWEAPSIYMEVSPFAHADKINEPILIIHGEQDNNPGTYPLQSERLFSAIKGNGGQVRYLVLPYESHGYRASESILHLLWERYNWVEKYLK